MKRNRFYGQEADYQEQLYVKKRKRFCPGLLLILVVVLVLLPFYGTMIRYTVGTSFRLIMDYLGDIFITVGIYCLFITGAGVLFGKFSIKLLAYGIILVYVGAMLTGGTRSFMGMTIYQPKTTPGFH